MSTSPRPLVQRRSGPALWAGQVWSSLNSLSACALGIGPGAGKLR